MVILHVLARYVSKPAILGRWIGGLRPKIEVQLEYQGLGSLGVNHDTVFWRLFFLGICLGFSTAEERFVATEDSSVSGVSGRYATALFELARDTKSVDAVKADLDRFSALLNESPDLVRLVRSPVFTAESQGKALAAVLDKAGIKGIAANFLRVLTANRRLFIVSDVIRAFRALVAKFKGEATADVTVAEKLSTKNLDALKAALKSVSGKDVDLNVKIDPSIIGGLVVKLGSRMLDSSLRTKLNSIKHAMKEAG
jgi:F-type H+-transporting ATPase subunit delta